MQHSIFPLTDNERGACEAALHLSQHTKIALLSSMHINERMELGGVHFESAGCDTANVLPITTSMFDCIVAYEVGNELHASFNDRVLHVLQNMDEYKQKPGGVIEELKGHTAHLPAFSCMPSCARIPRTASSTSCLLLSPARCRSWMRSFIDSGRTACVHYM